MMSAVSCSSSSGGIEEPGPGPGPGPGVAATGSPAASSLSAVLVSIANSELGVIPAKAGTHATPEAHRLPSVAARLRGHDAHYPKKSCALISASASASTSPLVLYMANEARHVAVTPRRSISGWAQWCPARTATPDRS